MNTKIKICGIKRFLDIEYLNKFFPDYAGFVFAKSKRRVTVDFAREAVKMLNLNIKPVGVFAGHEKEMVIDTALSLRLKVIQLHGREDKDYIIYIKNKIKKYCKDIEVWKAIPVYDESSLNKVKTCIADRIVLDTGTLDGFGGSGKKFNWNIAKEAVKHKSIVLAGGLNPLNVKEAINTVKPYAVDVSSGVETNSVKDIDKIKGFIRAAGCYYNIQGIKNCRQKEE